MATTSQGLRFLVSFSVVSMMALTGCSKDDDDKMNLADEPGRESDHEIVPQAALDKGDEVQGRGWAEPTYTDAEKAEIFKIYDYLDIDKLIPENLLKKTILFFHRNQAIIDNKDFVSIVDFSKHSRKERFFMINMKDGAVLGFHVAHGKKSDPTNSGYALQFSNKPNSEMSSLGFYLTGESYSGKHGYSRRVDGLSPTNSMVRERAVVLHGATYVKDSDIRQGRSQGCLAFSMQEKKFVIESLSEGSLIYAGRSHFD